MPKILYEVKKFHQETEALINQAETIINQYQAQGFNLTLRQLYYQFVARALIPNTERSYKTIGGIISDARRAGRIDWNAIEDRTRYLRKVTSWKNPNEIMTAARDSYHRDLWSNQARRVQVWIEKDALVGVIEGVCNELDVPFLSCRGYVSDSEIWREAQVILYHQSAEWGQETVVIHLGDHDPSGIDMTRDVEERLRLFTRGETYINVKRIALTMDQIRELNPPPNPAKITDSRYEGYVAKYGEESWELDALEPSFIVDLIRGEVLAIRDADLWDEAFARQESERKQIAGLIKGMGDKDA